MNFINHLGILLFFIACGNINELFNNDHPFNNKHCVAWWIPSVVMTCVFVFVEFFILIYFMIFVW